MHALGIPTTRSLAVVTTGERIRRDAPWAAVKRETLYGGGASGYTDYPTLNELVPAESA